jgi:hypothetical protein
MISGILNVVAMIAAIGAGPQSGPTVPASLAGDWVLAGSNGAGRIHLSANGTEVIFSLRTSDSESDTPIDERYRISGTLGAALTLDPVETAKRATDMETLGGFPNLPVVVRTGQSPAAPHTTLMPPRARLLPVSATVALWWQPHRRALFAYRKLALPRAFQGRYIIEKGSPDIRSIEVGAETITRRDSGAENPDGESDSLDPISIATVTDVGKESVRVLIGGFAHNEAIRIKLHGRRATLVQEIGSNSDTVLEGRFEPATPGQGAIAAKATKTDSEADPPPTLLGQFRISSLTKNEEAALTILNYEWSIFQLGGFEGTKGWAKFTDNLSAGAMRMTLRHSDMFFTIRRLDDDVSLIERDGQVFVVYRPDAPPPWAPPVGLADDVRLLCRELEAAGSRSDERTVIAAFERAGRSARSDVMRSIVEAIVSAPHEYRAAVLDRGLIDAGEPIPSCAGVDRLRALPGQRRPDSNED